MLTATNFWVGVAVGVAGFWVYLRFVAPRMAAGRSQ